MTLEKAIEIISAFRSGELDDYGPDLQDATLLSIEALKACKKRSDRFPNLPHLRLPGETED